MAVVFNLFDEVLRLGVPREIAHRLSRADGEEIYRTGVYDPARHRMLPSLIRAGETIDDARTREGIP
jgi:hypothetical protein